MLGNFRKKGERLKVSGLAFAVMSYAVNADHGLGGAFKQFQVGECYRGFFQVAAQENKFVKVEEYSGVW